MQSRRTPHPAFNSLPLCRQGDSIRGPGGEANEVVARKQSTLEISEIRLTFSYLSKPQVNESDRHLFKTPELYLKLASSELT